MSHRVVGPGTCRTRYWGTDVFFSDSANNAGGVLNVLKGWPFFLGVFGVMFSNERGALFSLSALRFLALSSGNQSSGLSQLIVSKYSF